MAMSQNNQNKKIYVGNIPYQVKEEDLQAFFAHYGAVENVVIVKDRDTGKVKGFAFVTFETQQQAQAALEANGKDFEGRSIRVNMANDDDRRRTGGTGGMGGRGGRHYG
jgi:cold-inducible RNA-binding protein